MADIAMPDTLRVRVRTRKGIGTVIKIRDDSEKSFLVKLDEGGNPFWAINQHVQPVGFAQAARS